MAKHGSDSQSNWNPVPPYLSLQRPPGGGLAPCAGILPGRSTAGLQYAGLTMKNELIAQPKSEHQMLRVDFWSLLVQSTEKASVPRW